MKIQCFAGLKTRFVFQKVNDLNIEKILAFLASVTTAESLKLEL